MTERKERGHHGRRLIRSWTGSIHIRHLQTEKSCPERRPGVCLPWAGTAGTRSAVETHRNSQSRWRMPWWSWNWTRQDTSILYIGTNLCAGAAVGTCGYEDLDAQSYADWKIDFIKVDNCYYLWDNTTFSDAANARFVFAPNIRGIQVSDNGYGQACQAAEDGILSGQVII